MAGKPQLDHRTRYEITIQGRLDRRWSQWFSGLSLTACQEDGAELTTLVGPVADQAALRGILTKLWDLNLVLVSVKRLGLGQGEAKEDRDEYPLRA